MIQLETMTKAKLTEIEVLSQKNRAPEDNPGAKLTFEMELPSDMLALFDGQLRSFLLMKAPGAQADIPGAESEQLTQIGQNIGTFHWGWEGSGYSLEIDRGLGGRSNLKVLDSGVSGFRLTPKPNGFTAKFYVESEDISEAMFGKLAKLKSCEVKLTLLPPALDDSQGEIEQPKPRKAKGEPAAPPAQSATDAFIERHAPAAH